ncbi:bidirectional sugar transporter SWEET15 [Selaginella moellendorffii]|uniref:bidirectional sugar transporter SWEET15 n=2 Tax=Selaginella moellendorffii TaxID=88036 RepID=UPI000D1C40E0|nr:bidirectional sugar transporter SWEET15 [Selaginella moellendorffii]|eukprot:XP_002991789.2 bidirectional sugar transporter SWEET15 [Selaginella moellendorffii]
MADVAVIIGIIGNITSIMAYASPVPTFWYIFKKKSTECFSALPYVCTLLTVLLGLYYGCIRPNGMLIITINIVGITFEATYLAIFITYATKFSRIKTVKLVLLDLAVFGVAVLLTMLLSHGKLRVMLVGSMCSAVAISMYAAPLSVMRMVIRTKNVEFMPITLSAFLAVNASLWSAYSFFSRDIFIGIPSALGSLLAIAQVLLYLFYRNASKKKKAAAATDATDDLEMQKIEALSNIPRACTVSNTTTTMESRLADEKPIKNMDDQSSPA